MVQWKNYGNNYDTPHKHTDPWYNTENNMNCVVVTKTSKYQWSRINCETSYRSLCNLPSEICYKDRWNIIKGNININNNWNFSIKPCKLIIKNAQKKGINIGIISDRQWSNGNNVLAVLARLMAASLYLIFNFLNAFCSACS